jgi:hypothetical protein
MRKVFTTMVGAALALATGLAIAALAGAAPGGADGKDAAKQGRKAQRVLFAKLSGRNEIGPDGQRGAGDLNGRGGFTGLIEGNRVCFGLVADNIDPPAAAHIHRGGPGVNGPIEVTLRPPTPGNPGASSGCVPPDEGDTAVLRQILRNPRRFYVNVHTAAFPGGAIRGQLRARLQ